MKLLKRGNLVVGGVLLLLALILLLIAARLPKPLQSEFQAERWAGESGERYLQFACILTPGKLLEPPAVYSFRESALKKIAESDFALSSDGSAICDAWSTSGRVKVAGARGSFDAAALAVGGRFFDFHPQTLLSGVYLTETDLLKDRVVLDEQLAWMLFGASDVAGMTVAIGEQEFRVAGVVAQSTDRFTRAAGGQPPTIYLCDESRSLLTGDPVSCYETVLPDPVKGFARSVAEDPFARQGVVVQCTGRFSLASSLRRCVTLAQQSVRTSAAVFPLWENAAVIAETACALLRGAALLLLLFPAVLLIAAAAMLLRRGKGIVRRGGSKAKEALLDARDRRRARRLKSKKE